jgi:hypothetical protein
MRLDNKYKESVYLSTEDFEIKLSSNRLNVEELIKISKEVTSKLQ